MKEVKFNDFLINQNISVAKIYTFKYTEKKALRGLFARQ